jgi:SAM-dependent methyltransferase
MLVQRLTGDSTPFQFPVKPVTFVKKWPEEAPFIPEDFFRTDNNDDGWFYTVPKLVYHIDEPAVAALTQYYRNNIKPGSKILDICSSWVSHYPLEFPETMKEICATGMSPLELQFNDQLTGGYAATDLNVETKLPYPDSSFDVVTCVVSIDYLVHPIEILKEVHRVLRPGGKMIISQSNRCFPTKAIAMWLNMNDRQHLELINGYFQYAGGFNPRNAFDITATLPDSGYRDPMFIVEAVKA